MELSLEDLRALREGQPPHSHGLLKAWAIGTEKMTEHLRQHVLGRYVPSCGGKVKLLVGESGSGKTHHLRLIAAEATQEGYAVVHLSLRQTDLRLNAMDQLYRHVAGQLDGDAILRAIAKRVCANLNADIDELEAQNASLLQFLQATEGCTTTEANRYIRQEIMMLLTVSELPKAFRTFLAMTLRQRLISPSARIGGTVAHRWLLGEKLTPQDKKAAELYETLTRKNAMTWLYALIRMIRLGETRGLVLLIDDLDAIADNSTAKTGRKPHTPRQAADFWELSRQLVDATEMLSGFFCVMAMSPALVEHPKRGPKSYEAFWMRVQPGLQAQGTFNPCADLLDLGAAHANCDIAAHAQWLAEDLSTRLDAMGATISSAQQQEIAIEDQGYQMRLRLSLVATHKSLPQEVRHHD